MKHAMTTAAAAMAMTAMIATGTAHADGPVTAGGLVAGSRVRLQATSVGGRVQGTLVSLDGESLTISTDSHAPLRVDRRDLTRVEVVTGRHRNAKKGAIIGAIVGVAVTAAAATSSDEEMCPPSYSEQECKNERNFWIFAGIPLTALEGAGVGALIKSDTWSTVAVDRVKVGLAAPPRGRGIGLQVALGF